jgi:hypothetical protein
LVEELGPWAAKLQLVAHRIVHGGERFTAPVRLDPSTIASLEAITPRAPLHNGPAWALVGAGLVVLVLAARIDQRGARGLVQGVAMLVAVVGGVLLLRRPGIPGHGPRRWTSP